MDQTEANFAEFAEAFDESESYHTEEEAEVTAETEDVQTEEAEEGAETPEEGSAEESEKEEGNEPTEEKGAQEATESFTLKVNKEERTYNREEVIALAQKGVDYDRVKGQLQESRQKVAEAAEAMEVLAAVAKASEIEVAQLLDNLQIGLLKRQHGLTDSEAKERLLREKAEKENASLKAAAKGKEQETGEQRAQREVSEFREAYPEAELSKELLDKLMPEVQSGTPLIKAYQKYELAQKDQKIKELQQQLAAQKQNKANAAASPGSQKDSGGRRTKSDFDDFLEAFT